MYFPLKINYSLKLLALVVFIKYNIVSIMLYDPRTQYYCIVLLLFLCFVLFKLIIKFYHSTIYIANATDLICKTDGRDTYKLYLQLRSRSKLFWGGGGARDNFVRRGRGFELIFGYFTVGVNVLSSNFLGGGSGPLDTLL